MNNQRENAICVPYDYKVGENLLERNQPNKYESPYEGPYEILQVLTNGAVHLPYFSVLCTQELYTKVIGWVQTSVVL